VNPETKKVFRDYAWAYFQLHAGQRLQSFNFFLIVAGLLAGGITNLLKDGGASQWIAAVLGLALTFFSLVFWRLEERTKHLVKNAEKALKYLEAQEDLADEHENHMS
jgi:amino acid permease